jgi:hypothetical protein
MLPSASVATAACSSSKGRWQAVKCWWAHANEPEQRHATLRLLIYGSLAGSVSGAMAGMTGEQGVAAAAAAASSLVAVTAQLLPCSEQGRERAACL